MYITCVYILTRIFILPAESSWEGRWQRTGFLLESRPLECSGSTHATQGSEHPCQPATLVPTPSQTHLPPLLTLGTAGQDVTQTFSSTSLRKRLRGQSRATFARSVTQVTRGEAEVYPVWPLIGTVTHRPVGVHTSTG